jgi:hypothetical protein
MGLARQSIATDTDDTNNMDSKHSDITTATASITTTKAINDNNNDSNMSGDDVWQQLFLLCPSLLDRVIGHFQILLTSMTPFVFPLLPARPLSPSDFRLLS